MAEPVAVFDTSPVFTSAWVTVWLAGHVSVAPGASEAGWVGVHVPKAALASDTDTFDRVTLPVFVTTIEYVIVSPAFVGAADVCAFTTVNDGAATIGVTTGDDVTGPTVWLPGSLPEPAALFVTDPAFTSAWVTVWEAGHVTVAPGARLATVKVGVHGPRVALASDTDTFDNVTLPVFVSTIEYVTVSPAFVGFGDDVWVLTTVNDGAATIGVTTGAELTGVTGEPPGLFADPDAVFVTDPAFTSACVTVCDAGHVIEAPGASVAGTAGTHVPIVALASVTLTFDRVTLPVFVSTIEYVIVSPAFVGIAVDVWVLTTEKPGAGVIGVDTESASDTAAPTGGVPDPFAVFDTEPAFTSVCVTACDAEQVTVAPGTSVAGSDGIHAPTPALASLSWTFVNVTLPVFVSTIEYAMVPPAFVGFGDDVCVFTTDSAGAGTMVVTTGGDVTGETGDPPGLFADPVAVFDTEPEFTSAWVTV
jgi:hypothetical protein